MGNKLTTEEFINRARKIHGEKYDYSLMEYCGYDYKVKIICREHGEFLQTPNKHLHGSQCQKCSKTYSPTNEEFLYNMEKIYNDRLNFSKSIYITNRTPTVVTCPLHGDFLITPSNLNKKYGCWKCNRKIKDTKDFINQSQILHSYKYDYSLSVFTTVRDKIKIICKKHGIFNQEAYSHLRGNGCEQCRSSNGEDTIESFLILKNINYIKQYKFNNCTNPKTNHKLKFDFYLPNFNTCIEFDGAQHFIPVKYWGGDNTFKKIQYRDSIKTKYCFKNNISLIRINYTQNIEEILKLKLLNIKL